MATIQNNINMAQAKDIIKTGINIVLGIGSVLILNDNADAVYLNLIGVVCLGALLAFNKGNN